MRLVIYSASYFTLVKGSVMSIECSVVSKSRVLYSGEVYSIVLPGIEGDIGILENHEPFMTYLKDGVIWGRVDGPDGAILSAANMGLCPGYWSACIGPLR